jgi:hypothetical protein
LWAIAVFPGAPGWTVVKTAPFELLAETSPSYCDNGTIVEALIPHRHPVDAGLFCVATMHRCEARRFLAFD